jgi:hypothetical protein
MKPLRHGGGFRVRVSRTTAAPVDGVKVLAVPC